MKPINNDIEGIAMERYELLVPTYPEGAMNVGVADVAPHVGHARVNKYVFWDMNDTIDPETQARLIGSYLYLVQSGGVVEWRFTIVKILPGHKMYRKWVDHAKLGKYFTDSRKYTGENLRLVENGKKCATLFLLKRPESVGPLDVTEFIGLNGEHVRPPVRGSHRLIKPLGR